MDDDNGLELSLALAPPTTGDASTGKGKVGSSSETRSDISDRDTKLINEFKQFLDGGSIIPSGVVSQTQRVDASKAENFFTTLPNNPNADVCRNLKTGEFWAVKERSMGGEENQTDLREKRKNVFGESSQVKRHEKDGDHSDSLEKPKVSYISINTDDGSAAENEDVADSETEASTSKRQVSQQDDVNTRFGGPLQSEVRKDSREIPESFAGEMAGQKRFSISSDKEFKMGNIPHGFQFPTQSMNVVNMGQPLSAKDSSSSSVPMRSSYSLPSMLQAMAAATAERAGNQSVMPANVPLMVSYSSSQLPALDKDNSRLNVSHQQMHPSFLSRVSVSSDKRSDSLKLPQAIPPSSSDGKQHEGKASDHHQTGNGHLLSAGSASLGSKDGPEVPKAEGFTSEYPTIKPGIAADLKFGGSGADPNLPWVSTTAPGPQGRTISGVTYRFSPTQIKIVCACHGLHMSPEEFVRHASEEPSSLEGGAGILPTTNPATSAQS